MRILKPTILNQKGAIHFLAPLAILVIAGVIGAFTLVSRDAQEVTLRSTATTAAKPKKEDVPTGTLLIYSEGGKYKKAVITSFEGGNKCGKTKANKTLPVTVNLTKGKVGRAYCTGGTNYTVTFLKKGEKAADQPVSREAAAGLSTGYCSFVHKTGVTRVEKMDANKKCSGDDNPDEDAVTEKQTPIVSSTTDPNPAILGEKGKKFTFIASVKLPNGEALSPEECAGSISLRRVNGPERDNYGLRYNKKTKSCQFKYKVSTSEAKKLKESPKNDELIFSGNAFLNPATDKGQEFPRFLQP